MSRAPATETSVRAREHRTRTDARAGPPTTRRFRTAGVVAGVAVLLSLLWAALVVVPLTGEGPLTRIAIPGETTIDVQDPDERVVYYERETWAASRPMSPRLDIEVVGPAGDTVPVDTPDIPVHYRLPGLVGEAAGTFAPDRPGEHTVTVEATQPLPDDARAAVGPSIAGTVLGGLIGPLALVVVGLIAAAVIAVRAAAYRSTPRGAISATRRSRGRGAA